MPEYDGRVVVLGIETGPEGEKLAFIDLVKESKEGAFHLCFTKDQLVRFMGGLMLIMSELSSPGEVIQWPQMQQIPSGFRPN